MLSLNKYLEAYWLVVVSMLLYNITSSQNLISNSSFENYSSLNCSGGASTIDRWDGFYSPDYYTENCPNPARGVPINDIGYLYGKHGIAYMGFIAYIKSMETKEYIYQQLSSPLTAGTQYCLSFYTSKADNVPYAIKNIGAHFSPTLPTMVSYPYLTNIPQVVNQTGFITDTINWAEIQGCFIAQGGEQYITIGNFNSNANTDTIFSGTNSQLSGATGYGYYYIDSVTLWRNNFPTVVKYAEINYSVSIYPNPVNSVLNIQGNEPKNSAIEISNNLGQIVFRSPFNPQINLSDLSPGIYFLKIQNGYNSKTIKIIKQ